MSFYDKYPQLKQRDFLFELLSETIYATMALEDQTVAMDEVNKIVAKAIANQELKGGQFLFN